jgi:hypothetical protein
MEQYAVDEIQVDGLWILGGPPPQTELPASCVYAPELCAAESTCTAEVVNGLRLSHNWIGCENGKRIGHQ